MTEDNFHLGIKALIRNEEGKILLLRVNPKGLKKCSSYNGKSYWDIPGGRIHRGNTVEQTLRREIEEETGIKDVKSFQYFLMVLSNIRIPLKNGGDVGLILGVYLCDVENAQEIKLSDEHTACEWVGPREAAELLAFKYPQEFTSKIAKL